ncbi:hypothetical protein RMCBS344292_10510 [Rhizopus microsporus]|nr:hypothetical protein RMCBS344292_10510 [Rhizopus microsporus]
MSTCVKLEPEDDFMSSYLNTDYLSTEAPLSPPNSTTSSSSSTGGYSPEKQAVSDFMLDMSSDLLLNDWPTNTVHLDEYSQQNPQEPNNDFFHPFATPFFLPTGYLPNAIPVEQPKKKRGRKKREVPPAMQPAPPSLLAPKPLAPRPTTPVPSEPIVVKIEKDEVQQELTEEQEAQKQAQLAKRQERLIKNRAAALLSRKRKREHVNQLEEENQKLHGKVDELEKRVKELEKENSELKQRLSSNHGHTKSSTTKATGVVFMILLFSFALFTLPSRSLNGRLTVGGSSLMINKQYPLIESPSHYDVKPYYHENHQQTDLVLIDSVRPRDLQTWINHKLEKTESSESSHVYLYSKEFSQMASPMTPSVIYKGKPMLSLISPYNQTSEICDRYLQIDVQVLGSKVIDGHLMSLQQYEYPSALLDGMKKGLITYPRTPTKKNLSRVIT